MTFSVIVPTYNRVASLSKALESLLQQDFSDYEIIVVDDGSKDGTAGSLKQLVDQRKIHYIRQANRGPASARNAGINVAQGKYVALTDDDCLVPKHWLRKFHEKFLQTDADILGGTVRNRFNSIAADVSQKMTNHFVEYLGGNGQTTAFLTSNNIAYRKDALQKAGGFDEKFWHAGGEERALNYKIIRNGGRGLLVSDNVVDHYHELDALGFIRQQINYGRGAYLLYAGSKNGSRPKPMPVDVYTSLLTKMAEGDMMMGIINIVLCLIAQFLVMIGFGVQMLTMEKKVRA